MSRPKSKKRTCDYFSTQTLPKYCYVCGNPVSIQNEAAGFDDMTGEPIFQKVITCSKFSDEHLYSSVIEVRPFHKPKTWWDSFCEWFHDPFGRIHG